MRSALFLLLCAGAVGQSIRDVDFRNYSFPTPDFNGDDFGWQSSGLERRLTNGQWAEPERQIRFSGLTLESISYADVTGDEREDALVTIRYDTGGSMNFNYVYAYAMDGLKPRLLSYYVAGDRAYWGLQDVKIERSVLILQLFDPEARVADCCSERIVRRRYRWNGVRFVQTGPEDRESTQVVSRRAVGAIGISFEEVERAKRSK